VRVRLGGIGVGRLDPGDIVGRKIVETIEENPVGGLHRARRQR
jgi:hypothetical protein